MDTLDLYLFNPTKLYFTSKLLANFQTGILTEQEKLNLTTFETTDKSMTYEII